MTLLAGKNYTQTGSHVMAPGGNITVAAENIAIQEAREAAFQKTETRFKQTGLTVAISNPVVNAIQTAERMSQAANNTSDGLIKPWLRQQRAYLCRSYKGG